MGAFSFNALLISRLILPANLSPTPLSYVLHEKGTLSWVCKVQLARNISRNSEGLFFHLLIPELPQSRYAPLPIDGVNGREELRACGHYEGTTVVVLVVGGAALVGAAIIGVRLGSLHRGSLIVG